MWPMLRSAFRHRAMLSSVTRLSYTARRKLCAPPEVMNNTVATRGVADVEGVMGGEIEGCIWLDNMYPIIRHIFDIRRFFISNVHLDYVPQIMPSDVVVKEMIPQYKEGGVFVFFVTSNLRRYKDADAVCTRVTEKLKANPLRTKFSLNTKVKSHLVQGKPFAEDIVNCLPSTRVKITMVGKEVPEDILFNKLRDFGLMWDLVITPATKDLPATAMAVFQYPWSAVGVRKCLHNYAITKDSVIKISYDQFAGRKWFTDFASKNPRTAAGMFAAVFSGMMYVVFDPIRVWSIKRRLSGGMNFSYKGFRDRFLTWFENIKKKTLLYITVNDKVLGLFSASEESVVLSNWSEREEDQNRIHRFLKQNPERILIVTGPKGTGKSELVKQCIRDRPLTIYLDFQFLLEKNDDSFLKAFCDSVGFFPAFLFLNSLLGLVDSFVPAGAKLSASPDSQVAKVMDCFKFAVERLVQERSMQHIKMVKAERAKINIEINNENESSLISSNSNIQDITIPSDCYPTVVVDGFNTQNLRNILGGAQKAVLEDLISWAVEMAERRLCRVIFIADTLFFEEVLAKKVPEMLMEGIVLSDASNKSAIEFVARNLPPGMEVDDELIQSVGILGGRFSDLRVLVRKMRGGTLALDCVEEIVLESMMFVRQRFYSRVTTSVPTSGKSAGEDKLPWTSLELWQIISKLVAEPEGELLYDDVLFNSLLLGEEPKLKAMIREGLLSLSYRDPSEFPMVRAGSPVMLEAFRRMVSDPKLGPGMDALLAKELIKRETVKITAYETELQALNDISSTKWFEPEESVKRRAFLLARLAESSLKVEKFYATQADSEKRLKEKPKPKQLRKPKHEKGWFWWLWPFS